MATTKIRHDDGWMRYGEDAVSAGDDAVALRHHLDALLLKLAEAQAGSIDAVRQSRRHAEAALQIAGGSACEHARASGIRELAGGRWICDGCGASWPGDRPLRPAPVRTRLKVHDAEPVATVPDPVSLDEPVNSL